MQDEPRFRKATASTDQGCVEVALLADGGALVRDSKDQSGPVLTFNRREWQAFQAGVYAGEFDR